MNIPIVMAAFGTTTRARRTYDLLDAKVKESFPDHPVHWAFTSRMVRDRIQNKQGHTYQHPHQVLHELSQAGHAWAVVQSLHLVCGHEFDRLVDEVKDCSVRTSIGLPLLDSPQDYLAALRALLDEVQADEDEALVLVGHGTDHAIWAAYPALERMARKHLHGRVFVGAVEGCPEAEEVVDDVLKAGFSKVCLVPFMLVAGVHFQEDLCAAEEDSWKSMFEASGIGVRLDSRGMGELPGIGNIFCSHIREALDVIPDRVEEAG
ncbi:sirohydrochlorin cobaltochelatase [Desulfovermiculus halophilus]|uniref:sirohydrochlorin cobaltochelatase n=1 Tax=Desulfovermiculus halophilus TaxID=339722 RepID=UPI000485BF24|nr:sirohydrochlorin cobaltochelatase [Desulfovermiculus halophilus]